MINRTTAPAIEIPSTWCDAWSLAATEIPISTITKLARISSVAVSFGRRGLKRIRFSPDRHAPAITTRPSTSSAFANRLPRIEVCATTTSPARNAKMTMKSSGRFPSVDWSTPVTAGPYRSPTCSVEKLTIHASPARATVAAAKAATAGTER